jgi:hypothetical protein
MIERTACAGLGSSVVGPARGPRSAQDVSVGTDGAYKHGWGRGGQRRRQSSRQIDMQAGGQAGRQVGRREVVDAQIGPTRHTRLRVEGCSRRFLDQQTEYR